MTINHTTLGEIVKGRHFPMIEYRCNQMNMSIEEYRELLTHPDILTSPETIYCGLCGYTELNGAGRLTSHDGDTYHLSDELEAYHIDGNDLIVWTYIVWRPTMKSQALFRRKLFFLDIGRKGNLNKAP